MSDPSRIFLPHVFLKLKKVHEIEMSLNFNLLFHRSASLSAFKKFGEIFEHRVRSKNSKRYERGSVFCCCCCRDLEFSRRLLLLVDFFRYRAKINETKFVSSASCVYMNLQFMQIFVFT